MIESCTQRVGASPQTPLRLHPKPRWGSAPEPVQWGLGAGSLSGVRGGAPTAVAPCPPPPYGYATGYHISNSCCFAFRQSGSSCSQYIHVDGSGNAQISIPASNMAAMHVGGNPNPTGNPVTQNPTKNTGQPTTHKIGPTTSPPEGMRQTVIFLDLQTQVGQDLFIRGGIGQSSSYGNKRSNK